MNFTLLFFILFTMKLIAHRGNNSDDTENKINKILINIEKEYISGIEIDVNSTKDYKFVLSHNKIIKNKNSYININKTNYKEIENIELLTDLLDKIKNKKIIILECKLNDNYKEYAKKFIKIIKKYKYLNIYICSFHYEFIKYIKKLTKYKVGLLIGYLMNINKDLSDLDFVSINYNMNEKKINLPYFVWTVNSKSDIKKISINKYFMGIITDKSKLLK